MKYLLNFLRENSSNSNLYRKIDLKSGQTVIDVIDDSVLIRGGYCKITENEYRKIDTIVKGYKVNKTNVVDLTTYIVNGRSQSDYRIIISLPQKVVEIVKDNDDFYYVTSGPTYIRIKSYYECDSFQGLSDFLHEVAFIGYKKQDYEVEKIRKELLSKVNKMSSEDILKLNTIISSF